MTNFMVDIEADGPIPGDYSMFAIGAVVVEKGLSRTFQATLRPISEKYLEKALAVCRKSRMETLQYEEPKVVMARFRDWVASTSEGDPRFISDNNGFDWMFVCWYFHHFLGENPFGYSSMNLGSLYKGMVKNTRKSFKYLRITKHTHDPLDDAIGNCEALLRMKEELGLEIDF